MVAVNWTREQTQVIESRGKNLLVSAAAGSGKTAVLVERIIRLVTEGEHPLNIDELLVMTFTNAAAAEMRERIGVAIEEKLRENPGDAHLQMQSALVHHAQITTIDSFCLRIIREHFQELDIDPSFRVGDDGELLLLRADAMGEMLENYYENGGSRFEQFVETYAQGKSDAGIEDYIMQVYTFAQSNPDPQQWIADCRAEIGADSRSDAKENGTPRMTGEEVSLARPAWEEFLISDLGRQARELAEQMREAYEICRDDEYLCAYAPMLLEDTRRLTALSQAKQMREMFDRLTAFIWDRLATVRSKSVDPERKAYVTGCRDRAKKAIAKMKDLYCFAEPAEMEADGKAAAKGTEMLLELAEEFSRRFQEKKRERNLVDFNDLEHEALRVLITRREDGTIGYTDAADELSHGFGEVLVDEYQDSNLVQETLLQAVSGERFGRHNLFMVGDVKQSIYKFRLARPEIFLDKYEKYMPYDEGEGVDRKIELHQNFRSRAGVLDGVNDVFFRIMTENLGNIRYSKEAALYPGAVFEALPDGRTAAMPELLMVDTGGGSLAQPDDDAADYTAKEIEAKLIVRKIREMTDPKSGLLVWDKKENCYRIAQYRDMVILLRSTVGWTETLLNVLMNEGIPAYAESREGYFNTIEVETVLSLLSVIDNPMQDIPLTAVLKSPIVGMSDQELAEMMIRFRQSAGRGADRGMYGAMQYFLRLEISEEGSDAETSADGKIMRRLRTFWKLLTDFREKSRYLPIHELLYEIYEKTGYDRLVSVMPAGATRRANLDMLVEKAAAYEKTSYKGLFHFVRYIENLKRYHTDFGEASTVGEEENTVRILSIHKSKGLEFPVVFLAGMGKKFNRRDGYGKVLIDPELGIATDYLDTKRRLKAVTLKKNVLRRKMELDNLGEELRMLYVAMTRAKEMLVMTGTDRYLAKNLDRFSRVPVTDGRIPYTVLGTAGSYLDWLLMASGSGTVRIRVEEIPLAQIVGGELVRQVQTRQSRAFLESMDRNRIYDEDVRNMLEKNLSYHYPHAADIRLPMQASVSELKRWRDPEEEEPGLELFMQEEAEMTGPSQEGDRVFLGGATRGTAYHRVLELLPFDRMDSQSDIERYIRRMVQEQKLSVTDRKLVNSGVLWRFLDSDLGRRMRRAQAAGQLYKERQFVMGVPAHEMGLGDSDEMVVVQGIIDSWFEEDGELVLVDYKTDRVEQAAVLVEHYRKQLDYYERALGQMTGKHVKEKMIYSLALQMEIRC